MGVAQPAGGQAPAAQHVARRFRLASPATATILGALVLLAVATSTLTALAHQLTIRNVVSGRDDLAGAVQQTLEPAHISVWMSERG